MKNKIIPIIVGVLVIGGGAFFIGMKYGEGLSSAAKSAAAGFAGRTGQFGGTGGQRAARGGGGFVSGQILSKDSSSLTVTDSTGGSKIIFLTSSTTIMKSSEGTLSDLIVGTQITATGSSNSDGSISAQTIQIRPAPRLGATRGN